MENPVVAIDLMHALYAGAAAFAIFFAVRYARVESYKRSVVIAEQAKVAAEEKLYLEKESNEEMLRKARKVIDVAKTKTELAEMRAAGIESRVADDIEANTRIITKMNTADDQMRQAFQRVLDSQIANADKLQGSLVDTVEHLSKARPISLHEATRYSDIDMDKDTDEE